MAGISIQPKSVADLNATSQPAGGLEYYPHVLYDTATYTSGTTTSLNFFTSIQSDKTLGNMEGASQLPENQWFEVHRLFCDPFIPPAAQEGHAATGPINDIFLLLFTGQGIWQLTYQAKTYGPEPLSFLQASGAATGFGWATMTAEAQVSYGVNGNPASGGYYLGGRVIYRPKTTFQHTLTWTAAQTLANGNSKVRVSQQGVLYRAVL